MSSDPGGLYSFDFIISTRYSLGQEDARLVWVQRDITPPHTIVTADSITVALFDPSGVQRDFTDTANTSAVDIAPSQDATGSVTGTALAYYVDIAEINASGESGYWCLRVTSEYEDTPSVDYIGFYVTAGGSTPGSPEEEGCIYGDTTHIENSCGVTATDLGMTTGAFSAFIEEIQERAAGIIHAYTHRDFCHHTNEVERIDGNNTDCIRLRGYPVTSIVEVTEDDTTVSTADYRVKKEDLLAQDGGVLERRPPNYWFRGWNRYRVTYDWGYTTPPGAVTAVAESLSCEALQAAKNNPKAGGLSGWSMDGFSVSLLTDAMSGIRLSTEHKEALKSLRSLLVA